MGHPITIEGRDERWAARCSETTDGVLVEVMKRRPEIAHGTGKYRVEHSEVIDFPFHVVRDQVHKLVGDLERRLP